MYTVIYRVKVNGNWKISHTKPMPLATCEIWVTMFLPKEASYSYKKVN